MIIKKPIKGTYEDHYEIYSVPPVSSGGTHIIQMLNILEKFNLSSYKFGSSEYLHLLIEVLKIAASLENLSEHPIAKAITSKANQMKLGFYIVANFLLFHYY